MANSSSRTVAADRFGLLGVEAPTGGEVWLTALRQELLRFTAEGKPDGQLGLKAVAAVPDLSGGAWVATEEELLRVDKAGATKLRVKHARPSNMAWIALD